MKKIIAILLVPAVILVIILLVREKKRPPNVILISIDTLRADRLGCYGYRKPTSPNLDRFAGNCFIFTEAISQSSWTLPSHMSILTSLYPGTHKVGGIERSLDPKITTLTQILKKAGYQTAGFVDAKFVGAHYGFNRGFDVYRNKNGKGIDRVLPLAEEWLRQHYKKSFFLFFHVFDCHCPYTPPEEISRSFSPDYEGDLNLKGKCGNPHLNALELTPEDIRYISEQYDGEIRSVDTEIQKLFDLIGELGLYRNTLIILLSDHGEEFKEHGQIGHQRSVYHELMHIPLIIRLPGSSPPAGRITSRVESIDIMPTVLDFLGLVVDAPLQGKSLTGLLSEKEAAGGKETSFGELNELAVKRTLYSGNYQYIYNVDEETEELYDLKRDLREEENLASQRQDKCRELKTVLESWEKRAREDGEKYRAGEVTLGDDAREQLRNLGYIE